MKRKDQEPKDEFNDSDFDAIFGALKKNNTEGDLQKDLEESGLSADDFWNMVSKRIDDDYQEIKEEKEKIEQDAENRQKRLAKVYHLPQYKQQKEEKEKLEIFHEEILAPACEEAINIEDRYWLGMSQYIDGECTPGKQRKITEHLLDCGLCRERFNGLVELDEVIKDKVLNSDLQMQDSNEFWNEMSKIFDAEDAIKPKTIISYKKLAVASVMLIAIGLGGIASFKYKEEYNFSVPPKEGQINWNGLNLNRDQQQKLSEIEKKWLEFKGSQEELINERKMLLDRELSKADPNLSIIDKFQHEILDHEILLKREEANMFLEKRFVLNEQQTLELLKQL